MKTVDFSGRPFHFIGVGGIGMSALAYILAKRQIPVSGSDVRQSHITDRLQEVGAHIFSRQEATNLELFQPQRLPALVGRAESYDRRSQNRPSLKEALPQVICSTAISSSNSEYRAAKERGCPVFHRSDVLAALIQDYYSIAVAGTHGKTTTSSLLGYVLLEAGLDPTIVVGGEVAAWEGNARLGKGRYLVAEADESDGSLTKHAPQIGVVTNIELDHPDHYQSLAEVVATFQTFESQCQTLVGCIDCEAVRTHLKPTISYSLNPDRGADFTVRQVAYQDGGTTAQVWEGERFLGQMRLQLPGEHNVSNALAAVAVGRTIGLEFETIASAIARFEGAKRRFELRGCCHGITFVDDYAHHPSEIRATLGAARLKRDGGEHSRVVAVFQPHRYSRTATFLEEFATAFNQADLAVITDIYSAGEVNLTGLSGERVAAAIARHQPQVFYQPSLPSLQDFLAEVLQPGDLALFLGAGNLNQIIPDLVAFYRERQEGKLCQA